MSNENTLHLLENFISISIKYNEIAKITGGNFNIFSILHIEHDEVRLHSRLLGELLSPIGSHNKNGLFLRLFLFQIGITDYEKEIDKAEVIVEEYIGNISDDYDKGGRIDIVIKFPTKPEIVIENKIFAKDQPKQLWRYYQNYKNAHIVYLTPFESKVSKESLYNLEDEKNVIYITYQYHIKNWIVNCIDEVSNLPLIREILYHYLNTINQITNQSKNKEMEKEIIDLISKNPESYRSALELSKMILQIDNDLLLNIFEKLNNRFIEKYGDLKVKDNRLLFFVYKEYEFFIKLSTENNKIGIWLYPILQEKLGCANDEDIKIFKDYLDSLAIHFNKIYENPNYTCWVYCKNDFLNYDFDKKIILFNENKVEETITNILSELSVFISTIKENLKNKGFDIHFNF